MEDIMKRNTIYRLSLAGLLTALAVAGSFISIPIGGSKCAPVQHMVNIFGAVLLGPLWNIGIAFTASLLRNFLGLGSLMAFPGSMIGALCCGVAYRLLPNLPLACTAEALGTGLLGGLAAYPIAKFLMNLNVTGTFIYVMPFFISTAVGSALAFALLILLQKGGVLANMKGAFKR